MFDLKKLGGMVSNLVLKIVSIENDDTENTQVLEIVLSEEKKVTGSTFLSDNSVKEHKSNKVYIAQAKDQEEGNISAFYDGLVKDADGNPVKDEDDFFTYQGNLKLDVSSPKINRDGTMREPAKLWLSKTRFNKGAQTLRATSADTRDNAVLKFFGRPAKDANVVAAQSTQKESGVEVVAAGGASLKN